MFVLNNKNKSVRVFNSSKFRQFDETAKNGYYVQNNKIYQAK